MVMVENIGTAEKRKGMKTEVKKKRKVENEMEKEDWVNGEYWERDRVNEYHFGQKSTTGDKQQEQQPEVSGRRKWKKINIYIQPLVW